MPDLLIRVPLESPHSGNGGSIFLVVQTINLGAFLGPFSSHSHISPGTACQSSGAHTHRTPMNHCVPLPSPPASLPWTHLSFFSLLPFRSLSTQQQRPIFLLFLYHTPFSFQLLSGFPWNVHIFAVACKTSSGLVSCQLADVFLHKSSYPATVTWALCCGSNMPFMPSSSAWKTLSLAISSALSLTPLRHLLKSHFLSEAFLAQHFPCPSSPSILCFIFLRGFYPSEPYYG